MIHYRRSIASVAACLALAATACEHAESSAQQRSTALDSLGARARELRRIRVRGDPELVENSAAAMSIDQPGVLFTINDSGNDPLIFALDINGDDRGIWRVAGATNVDWEAASIGPCGARSATKYCLYIGDTGDNLEQLPLRTIYRLPEPTAGDRNTRGTLRAERLSYRYSDGPHDVEAMYVAPNGDVVLISKRRRKDAAGRLRPALVFRLPASAWTSDTTVVASLVDSLPIVPGSAPLRSITDAALSPDARYLAVRTYGQVFIFAVDSATGRARTSIPAARCNLTRVQEPNGEGIAWIDTSTTLLLTGEGKKAPMYVVRCPLPQR